MRMWRKLALGLVPTLAFSCQFTYHVVCYFILMLMSQILRPISHSAYLLVEKYLYKLVIIGLPFWTCLGGYGVIECGEDVNDLRKKRCLVLGNHQSTADVPFMFHCFHDKGPVLRDVLWIIDSTFRYTPFGLISMFHCDFFIDTGRQNRDNTIADLEKHLRAVYYQRQRKWIVCFPEGGFLRKRKETSQRFAAKNQLPHLEHVILPRLAAVGSIMSELSSKHNHLRELTGQLDNHNTIDKKANTLEDLEWIIDYTLAYPTESPMEMLDCLTKTYPSTYIRFHSRKFPIKAIPTDTEEFKTWLYQLFVDKEYMIKCFRKHGRFPVMPTGEEQLMTFKHRWSKFVNSDEERFLFDAIRQKNDNNNQPDLEEERYLKLSRSKTILHYVMFTLLSYFFYIKAGGYLLKRLF